MRLVNISLTLGDLLLFIDTSAFVALEDMDEEHKNALDYREKIKREKTACRALYTSNYILDEVLALLRFKLGHRAAVAFGESLWQSKILRTLRVKPDVEDKAWRIIQEIRRQGF